MPHRDIEFQKRVVETNNYLKDLSGFYGFSFTDNSNITENYLHYDEILCLNKVGSFLLGQNFVSHFNRSFWENENIYIGSNSYIVNSGNLSVSNSNHVNVSDTQDVDIFINDEKTLYNPSSFLKGNSNY